LILSSRTSTALLITTTTRVRAVSKGRRRVTMNNLCKSSLQLKISTSATTTSSPADLRWKVSKAIWKLLRVRRSLLLSRWRFILGKTSSPLLKMRPQFQLLRKNQLLLKRPLLLLKHLKRRQLMLRQQLMLKFKLLKMNLKSSWPKKKLLLLRRARKVNLRGIKVKQLKRLWKLERRWLRKLTQIKKRKKKKLQ